MKLTLLTAAFAAVLIVASAPAQAQTTAATTNSSSSSTTSTTTTSTSKTNYGGTVTAVDTTANTVSVHSKKHDLTLAVTSDTKWKGYKALSDVKVGDKIRGSYTKDASGQMTAASLYKKS